MELIKKHSEQITNLCKKHKVIELYVFGSAVSDNFNSESDVDLLVKFGKVDISNYFDNFMDFKESLELLLNREVDIIEKQTLKNPVLIRSIEKNKMLIYGRADSKMAV